MSDLALLRPAKKLRVMDLVREAGIDVSDWANYSEGSTKPAANPRYCYEWAFVDPRNVAVLNIWYSAIRDDGGQLTLRDNMRASAARHGQNHTGASLVWQKRAETFDNAVKTAAAERLPIRVVICDGDMRRGTEDRASKVKARLLDPVPWAVTSYNPETGDFALTRGVSPIRAVDQFSAEPLTNSLTELRSVTGMEYVRDARVRVAVLLRAAGLCEWCGEPGFVTPSGDVFLETHHIVPLGEGGPDTTQNVVAVCANHHREAHYGAECDTMRDYLAAFTRGERSGSPQAASRRPRARARASGQ